MAVKVLESTTKVSVKYGADTKKDLSAYSVGIEVKEGESDDKYYDLALALAKLVDADGRDATNVNLTVTQIIE